MQTYDIDVSGHSIQISYGLWSGKETVVCDGATVSDQRSFRGATVHPFVVQEEGQPVQFEVTNAGLLGYVVRRNDVVVAERKRPAMAFLTAVVTLLVAIGLMEVVLSLLVSAGVDTLAPVDDFITSWAVLLAFVGGLPGAWWLMSYAKRLRPAPAV